ncbi:MAG TPA: Cof-type HAD-IIB family hydrolase [Gaiellales bacterium]|nr:Cof-type HAD-IIB family hydrolase [Gaiellales bacterium]
MPAVALPPWLDRERVELVAMDLDRTILPSSLELSAATVAAVAATARAGIRPVIATGRMFASALPYALQLGIEAPVICYQGALVADPVTGTWLQHQPMGVELAGEVIDEVAAQGFHMNVYVDDLLYVEELNPEAVTYARHARLEAHPVGNLRSWLSRPTTKIVVVGEPQPLDGLEERLRGVFGGRLFIAKSLPFFLEVAMPGVSKGAALLFVCERLGIDPAATVAFGDGANDIELLQQAGVGVAVADAVPALLEHADWVVPGVDSDGVAGFLNALAARG